MRRYELEDILAGTGGRLSVDRPESPTFLQLNRDARTIETGDLFIALRGEHFDGHAFVQDAIDAGASMAIVSEAWASDHRDIGFPLIVVDDPNAALQRWAAWKRARMDVRVVGITGSVGKTSAKESIAAVLAQRYKVYRSPGNFNNEIGLPLSILDCPEDSEVIVLEMGGAYAFGELTTLAGIAKPDVGVVLNVFPVHLERMGSMEAIAQTKQELVEAIPADGFVVLNHDDDRVRNMLPASKARVITYGMHEPVDIYAFNVQTEGLKGTTFWVRIDGEETFLKVPFVGGPGVQISMVALAVGHGFGMHVSEMLVGLQDPRIQVRLLMLPGPNGSQLIDDTYNASTPSVLAALGLLAEIPAKRRIVVLGEMRELGDYSDEGHRIVGGRAGDIADILLTFGDGARLAAKEASQAERPDDRPLEVRQFSALERDELIETLKAILRDGDVVLLKGARGLQMEHIVAELRADQDPKLAGNGARP